jgi:signal peptidase I
MSTAPSPETSPTPKKERTTLKDKPGRWFLELFIIIAIVAGCAYLVQAFIVKPFRIPSASMYPTLEIGQRVLVDRIGTWFSSPDLGDIVVFHPPKGGARRDANGNNIQSFCGAPPIVRQAGPGAAMCDKPTSGFSDEYYVKRVVGVPGDRLKLVNGVLYRNGKRVVEKYAVPCNDPSFCNFPKQITVPKGHYFMMGDNRPHSDDSRYWGPVAESAIIGEVFATYWPLDRIGGP